tara:strand:+ start:8071 stop:8328 length:258 start_codon:yes stop_codon:yes gene_type:complete
MKNSLSDGTYFTNDTTLAAWLISQGFELLDLDNSNPSSVAFLFDNNGQEFSKAIKLFQLGMATGNILTFFRAYKHLLAKIKGENL